MNKEQQIIDWFNQSKVSLMRYCITYLAGLPIPFLDKYIIDIDKGAFSYILSSIKKNDFKLLKIALEELLSISIFIYLYRTNTLISDDDISSFLLNLKNVLIYKNRRYKDSFSSTIRLFGYIAIALRLHDKIKRLSSLLENIDDTEDTLLDIAGYCVLALIYIENHKEVIN